MQNEKINIELKKLDINLRMSQETTMFIADLHINGVKVGETRNDGHGGSTFYQSFTEEGRELIKQAEAYFKSLPQIDVKLDEKRSFKMQPTLDSHIDDLVEAESVKKQLAQIEKKMVKDFEKGLCFGDKTKGYQIITWKGMTISQLLAHPNGLEAIRKAIVKVKAELKANESILNTNIPSEILA